MIPAGWPELAGDPSALRAAARRTADTADGVRALAGRVAAYTDAALWRGAAAAGFGDDLTGLTVAMRAYADALEAGARGVLRYAAELEDVQAQAQQVHATAVEARQAAAAAPVVAGAPGRPDPAIGAMVTEQAQRIRLGERLLAARSRLAADLATPEALLAQLEHLGVGARMVYNVAEGAATIRSAVRVQGQLHPQALRAELVEGVRAWTRGDAASEHDLWQRLSADYQADAVTLRTAVLGGSRLTATGGSVLALASVPGSMGTILHPGHDGLRGAGDRTFATASLISAGVVVGELTGAVVFAPEVAVAGAVLGLAAAAWELGSWVADRRRERSQSSQRSQGSQGSQVTRR